MLPIKRLKARRNLRSRICSPIGAIGPRKLAEAKGSVGSASLRIRGLRSVPSQSCSLPLRRVMVLVSVGRMVAVSFNACPDLLVNAARPALCRSCLVSLCKGNLCLSRPARCSPWVGPPTPLLGTSLPSGVKGIAPGREATQPRNLCPGKIQHRHSGQLSVHLGVAAE